MAWFDDHGLLESVRDYTHTVGHSYRSHVPIEPWLSDQWYVAVTDERLRGSALRAQSPAQARELPEGVAPRGDTEGDGELTFFPERYAKTYSAWHENIRDWCISRQLWWGHRIPVWTRSMALAEAPLELQAALAGADVDEPRRLDSPYTAAGAVHIVRRMTDDEIDESVCVPPQGTLARLDRPDGTLDESALIAALEVAGFERDPDVLDTWFSSALWPMSHHGLALSRRLPRDRGPARHVQPHLGADAPLARSSRCG